MATSFPAGRRGLPHGIGGRNPNPNYWNGQAGTTRARSLEAAGQIQEQIAPTRRPIPSVLPSNAETSFAAAPVRGNIPGLSDIRGIAVNRKPGAGAGRPPGSYAGPGTTTPATGATSAAASGQAATTTTSRPGIRPGRFTFSL